ncbi:hypothetical protein INT45_007815 [Circinella minor]|uniref:Xeroderma pigmentosum group C-complementing protein n=1 Tax=Circinella minor TaxID=1195481 RepID=A0A8H7RXM2_9FUNG|nr:hypothetical protein INT45_007815 [Circinella minor]
MPKRGTKRSINNKDQQENQASKRRATRSSTRKTESIAESSSQSSPRRSSTTTNNKRRQKSPVKIVNDNRRSTNEVDSNSRIKKQKGKQLAHNQADLAEEFMEVEEHDAKGLLEENSSRLSLSSAAATDEDEDEDEDSDMDDTIDWEDVQVPDTIDKSIKETELPATQGEPQYKDVEVVFEAPRAVLKKSKWQNEYERNLREVIHHTHVMFLIGHFMIRNGWCASKEVQAVCLSVIPDHIQKQCEKKDESEKSFEKSVKWLMTWWKEYFTLVGTGLRTRAYKEYEFLNDVDLIEEDNNSIKELLEKRDMMDGEEIQTATDFVDKLVSKEGFRDTSAELFVAILRALSFDTRLVCSLQPVPYRIPSAKQAQSSAQKTEDTPEKPNEKLRFPIRGPRIKLESDPTTVDQELKAPNAKPPTVWAEVYNPYTEQWICVDPIRGSYNKRKSMQPGTGDRRNIMSIVLAFSSDLDGCIDVTRRYAANMAKSLRLREKELTKREKEGGFKSWWEGLYNVIQRKKWGRREMQEQDELEKLNTREPMPTSIGEFNNHPLYALERHLKKFEVLVSKDQVLGHIRGEAIYPRSSVKTVHTPETWMKQGRVIKDGEQPVKHVNARAVTMEKRRAQELAKQEGETLKVACYGEWQTEAYRPSPVVDGIVPKNAFGRVDLFTPEMLPPGAAHIPINGIAKIARKLGINYAEATVDFEFVKRRSVPVSLGIVVAKENEQMLLEAWEEHEHAESTKAIKKQEKEVYGRWRKLILGTLIKARLERDYGNGTTSSTATTTVSSAIPEVEPKTKTTTDYHKETQWRQPINRKQTQRDRQGISNGGFMPDNDLPAAGGFLPDEEDD